MLLYNIALFVLAGVGCVFAAPQIVKNGWHWAVKITVLSLLGAASCQGVTLITGGPGSDLRIVTELLASYGGITAASRIVQRPGNPWVQFGVPALLVIFLTITWWELIERFQGGGVQAFVSEQLTSEPLPSSESQEAPPHKSICDEENLSQYQRDKLCP